MSLPLAHLSASDLGGCAALIMIGFAAGITFAYRYLARRPSPQKNRIER